MNLSETATLITGAASGQGAYEAEYIARRGGAVMLADINDAAGYALAERLRAEGAEVHYVHLDVSREGDWQDAARMAGEKLGRLTGLVNNAALGQRVSLLDSDVDSWRRLFDVNVVGAATGIKILTPLLSDSRPASVVNISSVAGLVGWPASAYAATKWAVRGLTKTTALELAPKGIRVNSVHPGMIETPFIDDAPRELREAYAATVPMQREGTSEEVAPVVAFLLCAELSSYITGAEIAVDGGFSCSGASQGFASIYEMKTGEAVKLLK